MYFQLKHISELMDLHARDYHIVKFFRAFLVLARHITKFFILCLFCVGAQSVQDAQYTAVRDIMIDCICIYNPSRFAASFNFDKQTWCRCVACTLYHTMYCKVTDYRWFRWSMSQRTRSQINRLKSRNKLNLPVEPRPQSWSIINNISIVRKWLADTI